jgi:polyisoprenoid-binding protein YceI
MAALVQWPGRQACTAIVLRGGQGIDTGHLAHQMLGALFYPQQYLHLRGAGMLTGRFNELAGTFTFDDGHPEASKVKVEVDTDSIDSNHAERDKHLRSKEFLDTATYPKATFASTAVKVNGDKATITGNLTLHGVTKPIEIAAERIGGGDDPWGGFRQGFSGTTRIPLKDFGINFDLGPASQEVELTLNIEGVRQ